MDGQTQNDYGSLCTELYELLHPAAPQDELEFYLSYAKKGARILEPLCGSGRFLVPFLERGFSICGMDRSGEMLDRLRRKAPGARVSQADLVTYSTPERFDYIFVSSGSISLFTDPAQCETVLNKLQSLLAPEGTLVFAVETVAGRCPDDDAYQVTASVRTGEGLTLILKSRHFYEERTQTQFSPGIYELYDGTKLLRREEMDFQTHLYRFGEMEQILSRLGFQHVKTYSSFRKEPAVDSQSERFLFECGIGP